MGWAIGVWVGGKEGVQVLYLMGSCVCEQSGEACFMEAPVLLAVSHVTAVNASLIAKRRTSLTD